MLRQVQKPGLRFAASARDWRERFGRSPKEGARPLLILWPITPVALVYDYDVATSWMSGGAQRKFSDKGGCNIGKASGMVSEVRRMFLPLAFTKCGWFGLTFSRETPSGASRRFSRPVPRAMPMAAPWLPKTDGVGLLGWTRSDYERRSDGYRSRLEIEEVFL